MGKGLKRSPFFYAAANQKGTIMDKESKRAASAAYKERRLVGGVYSITNRQTGEKHPFSAQDLRGAENRFRFMAQTDGCTVLSLQKEWSAYGPEAFFFEVLERIEQGETQSAKEFRDDVKALEELWKEKLAEDRE